MLNINKFLTKNFEKLSISNEDSKTNLVANGFFESYIVDQGNQYRPKKIIDFNKNLSEKEKEATHNRNYFGAFVNTDYMPNYYNSDIIKVGIPRFIPKSIIFLNINYTYLDFNENHLKVLDKDLKDYLSEENSEKSEKSFKNDIHGANLGQNKLQAKELKEESKSKTTNKEKGDYKNIWIEISMDKTQKRLKNYNNERHKNFFTIPQILFKNHFPDNFQLSLIIEESLLFNPYKITNFDIALQKSMNNLFYDLEEPINLDELKPQIFYLLQGIPSKGFQFNEELLSFYITNPNVRIIGSLPKVTENFLNYFIEFGNKVLLIQTITHYYIYNSHDTPSVLKVIHNNNYYTITFITS